MSIFRTHKASADRSAVDRRRHRTKIEKAIREGVYNIVADESIIGQDDKKKIRIPVRGIKEYQFVYGKNVKQIGQSAGNDIARGDVIGRSDQKDQSSEAGTDSGEEFYEIEISLDELASYLFDDLELPDLEKKKLKSLAEEKLRRKGFRSRGIRPRLDKKQTLRRKIRRQMIATRVGTYKSGEGEAEDDRFPFHDRDLRYRHVAPYPKENTAAVVFFMMDTSGSMSKQKKFMARSYFFLIYQFLRYKYESVDVVFLAHDVNAYEVDEERFFTKGSSGGTIISSVLEMALNIIWSRYHPDNWNIYAFHCSDGDNWDYDVNKAIEATIRLKDICQLYNYCEIIPEDELTWSKDGVTSMMKMYTSLEDRKFKITQLTKKTDIWPSFKKLFGGKFDI